MGRPNPKTPSGGTGGSGTTGGNGGGNNTSNTKAGFSKGYSRKHTTANKPPITVSKDTGQIISHIKKDDKGVPTMSYLSFLPTASAQPDSLSVTLEKTSRPDLVESATYVESTGIPTQQGEFTFLKTSSVPPTANPIYQSELGVLQYNILVEKYGVETANKLASQTYLSPQEVTQQYPQLAGSGGGENTSTPPQQVMTPVQVSTPPPKQSTQPHFTHSYVAPTPPPKSKSKISLLPVFIILGILAIVFLIVLRAR